MTDLDERGISTVTGVSWKPQTLTRLLMSGRISGQREHRGEIVAEAEWPAIIAPQQTAQLRRMLSDPSRRTNQAVRRYLLVRLLRCGLCGATLVSRPRQAARGATCARPAPAMSAAATSTCLRSRWRHLLLKPCCYRLDTPELAAALAGEPGDPDAERWQAEIDQSSAELEEIAADARTPRDQPPRVARCSATRRAADHGGEEGAWPAQPHQRSCRPRRQRRRATRASGKRCP